MSKTNYYESSKNLKLKVVQINAVYKYSSTGRLTMEIHQFLKEHGVESWVFCTNISNPKINVLQIGNKIDYKIHAFLSRLTGLQSFFSKKATKKLLRHLDKIRPDIVHLGNLHNNYINLPLLLSYLSKKKIATVLTLHDCWLFTGHCFYYTKYNCDKWLLGCGHCPALHDYNKSWFFDRTHKVYQDKKRLFASIPKLAVIGVSEWVTSEARLSLLHNAKITKRIYNWINLNVFYPRETERDKSFTILGVAQSWSEDKGLSVFFRIAEYLPDCRVLMIGEIGNNLRLPKNVRAIGATPSTEELAKYYSSADVFVTCSVQETFGNVSAEALACGTPIIVNNATANPELVGQGCGFIADNKNINSYLNAIQRVRELGKGFFSENCRKFALQNFDLKRNILEYLNLYKQLLW